MVGWQTFHDQWLSEGFAEFSAGLYLQASEKSPAKYLAYWDHARHALVDKNQYGKRANDAGPLWIGLLLNSFKNEGAYNAVIYRKGGYVLHMLRSMMYDSEQRDMPFMAMMQDFVSTHMNGNATTESFQRVAEKHISRQMDLSGDGKLTWCFKEWVYGTAIPRYKFDYKLESQADGKYLLTGAVTQSEAPKDFGMLVPLYGDFDGVIARLGAVRMIGESTSNIKVLCRRDVRASRLIYFTMYWSNNAQASRGTFAAWARLYKSSKSESDYRGSSSDDSPRRDKTVRPSGPESQWVCRTLCYRPVRE
jgi:hypothetical protein